LCFLFSLVVREARKVEKYCPRRLHSWVAPQLKAEYSRFVASANKMLKNGGAEGDIK